MSALGGAAETEGSPREQVRRNWQGLGRVPARRAQGNQPSGEPVKEELWAQG